MIKDNIDIIGNTISGKRAFGYLCGIANYHRVQGHSGYREAAKYCLKILKKENVQCKILEYPADNETVYWTQRMPYEWNCSEVRLVLNYPAHLELCDFKSCSLSVVQRSSSICVDDAEIVLLDRGTDIEQYTELKLENKLVFIHGEHYEKYMWAVSEKGAAGIITDYMSDTFVRQRNDLYDERLYMTFSQENVESKASGFVLSPRLGDMLAEICRKVRDDYDNGKAEFRYPKAKAHINSDFSVGTIENVEAVIEGETDEEIIVTAHLCHPKPSANDNASGCAGAIEAITVINNLIKEGALKKPKRSIRLILVPEVTGTFAYLYGREKDLCKMKAGLNLDMIGRRQEGKSGLLGIMGLPDSKPSFIIDLLSYIVNELNKEIHTFNIDSYVSPYKTEILEYFGGSDNYVYCDPSIGIPCATIMQWLDKTYHSSGDTAAMIDTDILHKSCQIAAIFLYTMANLEEHDVPIITCYVRERFTKRLSEITAEALTMARPQFSSREKIEYCLNVFSMVCDDFKRFFCGDEFNRVSALTEACKVHFCNLAEEVAEFKPLVPEVAEPDGVETDDRYKLIPVRTFKGPISFMGYMESLGNGAAKKLSAIKLKYEGLYGFNSVDVFIGHRMNGTNTIAEIARLVGLESRFYSVEYVYEYVSLLHEVGLVYFK